MTDPRAADTTPLNPPDPDRQAQLTQLAGERDRDDQGEPPEVSELEGSDPVSDTAVYLGELEAMGGGAHAGGRVGVEGLEGLEGLGSRGLREGETDDPRVATEEGEAWVPPVDPPVIADAESPDGMTIAAGFGMTAQDEPFDADHHGSLLSADDEVTARLREALLADSRTSRLAGRVTIDAEAGRVTIRGTVDDVEDGDLLVEVASGVSGVTEVLDETEVPGL